MEILLIPLVILIKLFDFIKCNLFKFHHWKNCIEPRNKHWVHFQKCLDCGKVKK